MFSQKPPHLSTLNLAAFLRRVLAKGEEMERTTRLRWTGCLCAFFVLLGGPTVHADETGTVRLPIVNGAPATADQIFGTVGIYNTQAGELDCTGTLISPRLVLTAAHCVRIMNMDFSFGPVIDTDMIEVMVGALDTQADPDQSLYKVAEILSHKEFPAPNQPVDATGLGHQDDIAVLVLEEDVDEVKPVPIASMEQLDGYLKTDKTLTIAGYGIFQLNTEDSGILHIAEVTFQTKTKWEFLAGDFGASDACMGDSGGPVYLFIDGKPTLVGVTSRGRMDSEIPCGDGGIYTLVPAYIDWIDRTAEDQWQPPQPNATPEGSETTPPDDVQPPPSVPETSAETGAPASNTETVENNPLAPNRDVRPPSPTSDEDQLHGAGCTERGGAGPGDTLLIAFTLILLRRRTRSPQID